MVEYKVITFSIPYLEDELNRLATQGWRVVSSNYIPFKPGQHDHHAVILERNLNA